MMKHEMKLNDDAFKAVKAGTKQLNLDLMMKREDLLM